MLVLCAQSFLLMGAYVAMYNDRAKATSPGATSLRAMGDGPKSTVFTESCGGLRPARARALYAVCQVFEQWIPSSGEQCSWLRR